MNHFSLMAHAVFGSLVGLAGSVVIRGRVERQRRKPGPDKDHEPDYCQPDVVDLLLAGYFYVVHYSVDKAFILKGPWPFAHEFFMESKEHVVMMLLLLATYLPIIACNNLAVNKGARKIALWATGLLVLTTVAMEGAGAIISMGVRVALLPK